MSTKRAHMIPKSYLMGWADAAGNVEVIDITGKRALLQNVHNATVMTHAYRSRVLGYDLEGAYAQIESDALPVIKKIREGVSGLDAIEAVTTVRFLDMFLERGRYADQARVQIEAVVAMADGGFVHTALSLGDRITLSRNVPGPVRLADSNLTTCNWQIVQYDHLPTGDGAVLLWTGKQGLTTVTFPISSTKLLVIGHDLPPAVDVASRIAMNSRRWLIGAPGTLNLDWMSSAADEA